MVYPPPLDQHPVSTVCIIGELPGHVDLGETNNLENILWESLQDKPGADLLYLGSC